MNPIAFTDAFNAFCQISPGARIKGTDAGQGTCPVCGDTGSLKLWKHPQGAQAWVIGCDHKRTCTMKPIGLLAYLWNSDKGLWMQLKNSSNRSPVPATATAPATVPATTSSGDWKVHNNRLLQGYFASLKPLNDQATVYLQSRKIPKVEYDRFKWSSRTSAIVIPVLDTKGRIIGAKRRFLAPAPGKPRWSVVTDAIDGKTKTKLLKSPSQTFYGLHRINPAQTVVICEGTFDALSFENGISVDGVNCITPKCVELLRSYIRDRIWCVDNDEAGREKQELLKSLGERLLVVPAPYKDANEWLIAVPEFSLDKYLQASLTNKEITV